MSIKHRFSSPVDDGGAPSFQVRPSNWNDEHDVDGLLGALILLGLQPNIVPYLDAAKAGAAFAISDFVRTMVMNVADAAAFRSAIGAMSIDSPALTGVPTAPTQAPHDNSTKIATTAYIDAAIAALLGGVPAALDTLNELAAALGDDASFASTMTTLLALKAPLNSPSLTGTPTAPTATAGTNTTQLATTAFVVAALNRAKLIAGGTDLNTLTAEGTYYNTSSCPNTPVAAASFYLHVQAGPAGGNVSQRAVDLATGDTYQRVESSGVWQAWIALGFTVGQIPGTTGTTQPGAGKVGELISNSATSNFSTSGSPQNFTSITLTPGVWDVEAFGRFSGAGAVTSSEWNLAFGTTSGSITAGQVYVAQFRAPSGVDRVYQINIPRRRIAVSVNTTYYLNAQATFSGGTYGVTGAEIAARRVS